MITTYMTCMYDNMIHNNMIVTYFLSLSRKTILPYEQNMNWLGKKHKNQTSGFLH